MDKKDLDLLERAFATEIDSALKGTPRLMQTRAVSRAQKLVDCNIWRTQTRRGAGS